MTGLHELHARRVGNLEFQWSTALERWATHTPGRDELFETWAAVNGFYDHGQPVDNYMTLARGSMRDRRLLPLAADPWSNPLSRDLPVGPMSDREHLSLTSYFTTRHSLCRYYAWGVTAPWLLAAAAAFAPEGLVDPMAGTGWWALRLGEAHGVDVRAYDLNPPVVGCTPPRPGDDSTTVRPVAHGNGYHADTKTWLPVDRADSGWSAGRHGDLALLLVWPPYASDAAFLALRAHYDAGGRKVAYVGEGEGGCTGDDEMHEMLEAKYRRVDTLPCAQWDGLHDWMELFERS